CNQGRKDHSSTRALSEGPGSVGGPMRAPGTFHWLFWVWARIRGPHNPLWPGAP
ncbi:unnamed protein product, partial [Staurois parvus]